MKRRNQENPWHANKKSSWTYFYFIIVKSCFTAIYFLDFFLSYEINYSRYDPLRSEVPCFRIPAIHSVQVSEAWKFHLSWISCFSSLPLCQIFSTECLLRILVLPGVLFFFVLFFGRLLLGVLLWRDVTGKRKCKTWGKTNLN